MPDATGDNQARSWGIENEMGGSSEEMGSPNKMSVCKMLLESTRLVASAAVSPAQRDVFVFRVASAINLPRYRNLASHA